MCCIPLQLLLGPRPRCSFCFCSSEAQVLSDHVEPLWLRLFASKASIEYLNEDEAPGFWHAFGAIL